MGLVLSTTDGAKVTISESRLSATFHVLKILEKPWAQDVRVSNTLGHSVRQVKCPMGLFSFFSFLEIQQSSLSPCITAVWTLVFSRLLEIGFSQVGCAFLYDFLIVVKIYTT